MTSALMVSTALLWLAVVALALVVLALARQIGVLHERIAPAGALSVAGGPRAGEAAPVVGVEDLDGRTLELGQASEQGKSTLIFFLSPTCPVCKTLLPVLRSARHDEKDWLQVVLASDGDMAEQQEFVQNENLGEFTYVVSSHLGLTWQVGKLPYAVLIDEDGITRAKGLVNSREHLESLFEAKAQGVATVQDFLKVRRADGSPQE